MRLVNEQLVLESYGLRLYVHLCADCGADRMNESDCLSHIYCSNCGSKTLRLIRNPEIEILLKSKGRTVQ